MLIDFNSSDVTYLNRFYTESGQRQYICKAQTTMRLDQHAFFICNAFFKPSFSVA